MHSLAEFQQQFAAALLNPAVDLGKTVQAGLSVHRNTAMKGLIDALSANYPTVQRLVGEEWFRAAAGIYARGHLPRQAALALYDGEFADFLRDFSPAASLPYLYDVARLDRLWSETHFAADAEPLQADRLARLAPEALQVVQLQLHPSSRFIWCAHSAVTIWRLNRPPVAPPQEIETDDAEQGALFVRPHGACEMLPLSRAEYLFLLHIRAGASLGAAALKLLEQDVGADIGPMLARCIYAGVFSESFTYLGEST